MRVKESTDPTRLLRLFFLPLVEDGTELANTGTHICIGVKKKKDIVGARPNEKQQSASNDSKLVR